MLSNRILPTVDPRRLDSDGLPFLGNGERFYHASFELKGMEGFVEGVVAAADSSSACSQLLAAEAHCRCMGYSSLLPLASDALVRALRREEAIVLAPKVSHRVSMWKAAPANAQPGVPHVGFSIGEFGQFEFA